MNFFKFLIILCTLQTQIVTPALLMYARRGTFGIGISRHEESDQATCTIKDLSTSTVVWSQTRTFNHETGKFDNTDFPEEAELPTKTATQLFAAVKGHFTEVVPDLTGFEKEAQ